MKFLRTTRFQHYMHKAALCNSVFSLAISWTGCLIYMQNKISALNTASILFRYKTTSPVARDEVVSKELNGLGAEE